MSQDILTTLGRVRRTTVTVLDGGNRPVLHLDGEPHACDRLASVGEIHAGDEVLVVQPEEGDPVILGVVAAADPAPAADDLPEEIVLEATERLVLRVGEGRIEMRGDGRVLIRGTDLVSRADRSNRIRGGSVAIN